MSAKITLIISAIIFSLGILLIVILPFILGKGPASTEIRPADEKIAIAEERGVFRSDDGGKTWQPKSWVEGEGGSIAAFRVNQIIQDPVDPATLYLATDGNGLWVSRDRGDLWAQTADGAGILDPRSNVLAVAVNPDDAREWYAAVFQKNRGRLLRTADSGKTFSEIYSVPLDRFGVFDVYYDRARGAVSIVTGQGGFLETADRGRTWRAVRWFADGLVRILVNPLNPAVRFAVSSRGNLFRTEDYGGSWADASGSFDSCQAAKTGQVWFMDQNGALYLCSRHGVIRSRDNARTFERLPLIIPSDALPILAIAASPQDALRIAVSAADQIYLSRDGGITWSILASPAGGKVIRLLFDREKPETIYAVAQP